MVRQARAESPTTVRALQAQARTIRNPPAIDALLLMLASTRAVIAHAQFLERLSHGVE